MVSFLKVKILILNLTKFSEIAKFEKEYKELIELGFRVEEHFDQEGAIVFLLEKWT